MLELQKSNNSGNIHTELCYRFPLESIKRSATIMPTVVADIILNQEGDGGGGGTGGTCGAEAKVEKRRIGIRMMRIHFV